MSTYRTMFVACLVAFDSGCHGSPTGAQSAAAILQVDSAEYTVRFERPLYRANIAYTYSNRSGTPVSTNYCYKPLPPALEKQLTDGRWVVAYNPVSLTCLTLPSFRVESGATYRGTLDLDVAPLVEAISPTFRLILR